MKLPIPPALTALTALLIVFVDWLAPRPELLSWPWSIAGVLVALAGIALGVSVLRRFRALKTDVHTFQDPGRLVTDGVFRYSRNPVYLGFTLVLLGLAIALGSLWALALVPLFMLVVQRWYIRFEEGRLEAIFGDEYRQYRQRVRRWF